MSILKNRKILVVSVIVFIAILALVVTLVINTNSNHNSENKVFAEPNISVEGASYTVNGGIFGGTVVDLGSDGKPTGIKIGDGDKSGAHPDSLEDGKGIAPDQIQVVKEGSGDVLTTDNVAYLQIVEYDFSGNELDSTWTENKDGKEISVDLDDMVKDQSPESLRNAVLGAKVGTVFLWSTQNADDETKTDVWVVTIVGKDASIKVENPNAKAS